MQTARILRLLPVMAVLAAIMAWPALPRAGDDRVRVVATLPNLGAIATAIGGDRIDLTVIAHPSQDAHFVDPKPSFMVKLRKADLLLINGLDLEIGWVPPLTEGARNGRILRGAPGYIDCSTGVRVLEVPATVSRLGGDVHPYGNPHYLTDPLNAEAVASTIAAALAAADPDGAAQYEAGRKHFVQRLHQAMFGRELVDLVGGAKLTREAVAGNLDSYLDDTKVGGEPLRSRLGGWLGRMQEVKGAPVLTYHRDFIYFVARFGLREVDNIEPKPGIQPSARHLQNLVEVLTAGEVQVILTRSFVEHRSTDLLAEKTGAMVVTLPLEVGGMPGADDFITLYDMVVEQIAAALSQAQSQAQSQTQASVAGDR
jgi:zinc/manganese transport system substrate-binding protein